MIAVRINGWTHDLGKPKGWDEQHNGKCHHLAVKVIANDNGDVIACESAWEPTPRELALLNAGGRICLRVAGLQPPVMLSVTPFEAEEESADGKSFT